MVSYDQFLSVIKSLESNAAAVAEGPDPKVVEFMRILEEYRVKCEEEGNYLEAGRAHKQLDILRVQEEKRQQKAIKVRQITERQDVQLAHNMQFSEFNAAWDKYMEEYDNMAQVYIQQMTERHAIVLLEYQKQLRAELAGKPPKWSKELLEWRRRQHILARGKKYTEAQKLKRIADRAEQKEKEEMEQGQAINFARREAKYRQQQQAELQALLTRIEARRKEHIKQRNLDSKRLLQRN
ncbi:Aste57867_22357, partial [Symbiodinium microadriaticum]